MEARLLFLFFITSFNLSAQFVPDQLFVKLKSPTNFELVNSQLALMNAHLTDPFTIDHNELDRVFVISFQGEWGSVFRTMENNPLVEYVERVPDYQLFYTPNDLHPSQWNLSQIFAEQAWDETTGNNRIIAVVDDAILLSHEDLNANLWTNSGEIPGNSIDDDGNGYVDDVDGWDAADNDNDPSPPAGATASCFSHGSHCAGIAAAVTDNSAGIASIGFNSKIMPVKIGTGSCSGLSNAYAGVDYAIASGAHIISMSWGGGAYSITYQTIFDVAYAQNIICVAAAGNSNTSLPMYPASYNHVISVGSTTTGDVKSSFSNYGATIDVMAPGSNIYSCLGSGNSDYGAMSGTSMACPLVSGLISLMLSKDTLQTVDEIEACLKSTCDPIDILNPGYSGQLGAGRIHALNALECIKPISAQFTSDYQDVCPGTIVNFTDLSSNSPTAWNWSFPGGSPISSTLQNPSITYNTPGTYDVELIATNPDGTDTLLLAGFITVGTPNATISGGGTMLAGYSQFIRFDFTGAGPWDVSFTDGSTTYNLTGITANPYYHSMSPTTNSTYTITSFSAALCTGTFSGSARITLVSVGDCENSCFNKYYDAPLDERGHTVTLLADGGYAISGRTTTYGAGAEDVLVQRLDPCGNLIWSKSFGGTGQDYGTGLVQDDDGSLVVTGYTAFGSGALDYYLIKLDLAGTLLYAYHYGASNADYPRGIVLGPAGGYTMGGVTNSSGVGGNEICLFHVDDNGIVQWTEVWGSSANDFLHDLIATSDGGYLMSGYRRDFTSTYEAVLVKFDATGTVQWSSIYDNALGDEQLNDVVEVADGYVAVGNTTSSGAGSRDALILKVDFNGNQLWSRTYGSAGSEFSAGIAELANGNLMVAARSDGYTVEDGILILQLTDLGNLVSSDLVDGNGDESLWSAGKQIAINNAGNVAVVGYTDSYSSSTILNPLVIRSDTLQQFSCSTIPVTVTPGTPAITTNGYSLVNSAQTFSHTAPATVEQVASLIDSSQCDCSTTSPSLCGISADFTFTAGCVTDSVVFTDLSADTSGTIIDWIWDFGDGNMAGGTPNPAHVYSTPGAYDVELFVLDNNGCTDSITLTVNILSTFTINSIPDTTICEFDSVNIWLSPVCGVAPYTYSWSPATGVADTNSATTTISPPSTTTYTVLVTDAFGMTASASFTITVNAGCCASHAIIDTIASGCIGDSVFVGQGSLINGTPHTHEWLFPSSSSSGYIGDNPPPPVYPAAGNYLITLVLNDACGSDTTIRTVNVFPDPIAEAGNDTLICAPANVGLGSSGLAYHTYLWIPSTGLTNPNVSNPVSSITTTTTYSVTVTDQFTGCSTTDMITVTLDGCDSCSFLIPNVFTPNSDGKNDVFEVLEVTGTCEIYNLTIYNRWGQIIFTADTPDPRWNGRNMAGEQVPESTYYYVIVHDAGNNSGFLQLKR